MENPPRLERGRLARELLGFRLQPAFPDKLKLELQRGRAVRAPFIRDIRGIRG